MAIELGALDSVIAVDIATIPDLPDYKTPPAGAYGLLIEKIEQKEIADKTALQVTYVIDNVIELSDPDTDAEHQVVPGNKFTEAFFFDKPENIEMTLGALKKKFAGLAEALGTTNLKDILEGAVGLKVNVVITNRVNKKVTPHQLYATVRDMTLATS
jgi:hypothetical protein